MQLEPAIRNDLIELIAANFKTDEVNELGRLVLGCFDSNEAAGKRNHISLSSRKSAGLLVERCENGNELASLIKLVVEVDDAVIHGRPVRVDGLEEFLGKLIRTGIHYDFKTRKVVAARRDPQGEPNWGCLKDGGILAFALRDHPARAVRFAVEVQSTMPRISKRRPPGQAWSPPPGGSTPSSATIPRKRKRASPERGGARP